jgi:hypothetical protein
MGQLVVQTHDAACCAAGGAAGHPDLSHNTCRSISVSGVHANCAATGGSDLTVAAVPPAVRSPIPRPVPPRCRDHGQNPARGKGRRHSGGAADQVRAGDQSEDGQSTRPDDSGTATRARRRGDRIERPFLLCCNCSRQLLAPSGRERGAEPCLLSGLKRTTLVAVEYLIRKLRAG